MADDDGEDDDGEEDEGGEDPDGGDGSNVDLAGVVGDVPVERSALLAVVGDSGGVKLAGHGRLLPLPVLATGHKHVARVA